MLNRAERFKTLNFIRNCCIIGCFPAIVDLSKWQLLTHSATGRRRWPSLTYFGLFVLHSLYKFATLVVAGFAYESTPLHQLIIHAVLALSAPVMSFWYYLLYMRHSGPYGIFLRITLTGNIKGIVNEDKETTNYSNRLKRYTPQDLVAIGLPYLIASLVTVIIGVGIYYPNMQFLLYAGLPKQYQTWMSFTVLMVEEMRYVLMLCAIEIPVWILQIISFDLVNNQLKSLIESIPRTANTHKLESLYGSLRQIQLYVTIINVVNRHIIFTWKILCIGTCIGTGYAAIAHFGDYPMFGVMYYLMLFDGTFIYTVSYGKAFRIPELFKEAKQLAVLRMGQCDTRARHTLKRQIGSIPQVGIKVAEFHVMERESTPIFVHYVFTNIVSMLVAYNH